MNTLFAALEDSISDIFKKAAKTWLYRERIQYFTDIVQ